MGQDDPPNYDAATLVAVPLDGLEPLKNLAAFQDGTGADGPRSKGGKRILLDNSRVYVRFLPFVSGRVHLGRINAY